MYCSMHYTISVLYVHVCSQMPERLDFTSWNSYADEDFVYYDKNFMEKSRNGDEASLYVCVCACACVLAMDDMALSCCHGVNWTREV